MVLRLSRKMYYDQYDTGGFYPQLTATSSAPHNSSRPRSNSNYASTVIEFELIQLPYENDSWAWIQVTNRVIYGFLGIHGIQLLKSLNGEANVDARRILNSGARCVYPTTYNATYRALGIFV